MSYPGVTFVLMVGVGLGAFLYYMFGGNNEEYQRYDNGECRYNTSGPELDRPPSTSQDERSRRRRRGSTASTSKPDCTICLLELIDRECIQLSPCNHIFHKICIAEWRQRGPATTRNTCPNCRERIYE